jgi:orotate phosphoribosyltransferase
MSSESTATQFIRFAIDTGAIAFGEFVTKAGRRSPYFFNAGVFCDGASLRELAGLYAEAILGHGIGFDLLFGSAYKGIPLAAATAVALAERGRNVPFAYNRKEAKDHGEGGSTIGAPLRGRVLIIDDVISAGTSVRESVALIRAAGATPCGVVIALDRMERGAGDRSAVEEVRAALGLPVIAVATFDQVIDHLRTQPGLEAQVGAMLAYRERYGSGARG